MASHMIKAGAADIVVAGGVESMSRAPWVMEKPDKAFAKPGASYDTSIGWRFPNPEFLSGELSRDGKATFSMPETAEEVARVYGTSREDCDAFAVRSHERALAAIERRPFQGRDRPGRRQDPQGRDRRRHRRGPARRHHRWTCWPACAPWSRAAPWSRPGNASSLNDGASAIIVASDGRHREVRTDAARPHHRTAPPPAWPRRSWASAPCRPPARCWSAPASRRATWPPSNSTRPSPPSRWPCMRELGLDPDIVNTDGGAIALGHPLGSSGSRHRHHPAGPHGARSQDGGRKLGLATMCVGVGQGTALLIEGV